MLVLTRRAGEQVFINKGQIQIKVLHIRNGNVALGIKAPNQIEVDREEIYYRKQEESIDIPTLMLKRSKV